MRFRKPRLTSSDTPSGETSQMRTATSARGLSDDSVSCASVKPSISVRSRRGAEVKHNERPSSARWSGGSSPAKPQPVHAPAFKPVCWSPLKGSSPAGPGSSASTPSARRCSVIGSGRSTGGHADSATQRPGRSTCGASVGSTHSWIHAVIGWLVEHAVLDAFERAIPEAQRVLEEADRGLGRPDCGYRCPHGPQSPLEMPP